MGLFKNNKQKKNKAMRYLFISLGREINDIVEEVCAKTGTPLQDLGFALGKVNSEDTDKEVSFLLQLYFIAGVYYAKEGNDEDFQYEYITKTQKDKRIAEFKKAFDEVMEDFEEANNKEDIPGYIR